MITQDMKHELWNEYSERVHDYRYCDGLTSRHKGCRKAGTRRCRYCGALRCPEHMYMHVAKEHPVEMRRGMRHVLLSH